MSAQTAPMAELVPFRFEITDERLLAPDYRTMQRAKRFVDALLDTEGAEMWSQPDFPKNLTVVGGKAPQPVLTVLQAIAMGHDLDAVLDLLEGREDRP